MDNIPNNIKEEIHNNLKNKIKEVTISLKLFNLNIDDFKMPEISYNLKGRIGGKALYTKDIIKLNKELLLMSENEEEMKTDTLYHELGHLIAYHLFKTRQMYDKNNRKNGVLRLKPHGKEWKFVMKVMGVNDSTTHNMKTPKSNKQYNRITYICKCENREWEESRFIHSNIQSGAVYTCRKCKSKLKLKPGAKFRKITL